jgi:hypothetical protein
MDAVNKKIATVVGVIGVMLITLLCATELKEHMWFVFLVGLWFFVFCSSCYRLTPIFKARNRIEDFIQRDAQHLLLFSLTGFFDKKHGPQWLVIDNIERILIKDDELIIHSNNERQFSVSIPSNKTAIEAFIKRILTESEKQAITFE